MKVIQMFILVLIFSIGLYAKEKPENLLKELPKNVDYFVSDGIKTYDNPALGSSIAYNRNSIAGNSIATVYIYDLDFDIVTKKIENQTFQMAIEDIKGMHKDIILLDEGTKIVESSNH